MSAVGEDGRKLTSATLPHALAGAPRTRRFRRFHTMGVGSLMKRELKREWRFFGPAILGPALQSALFATVFALAAGGFGIHAFLAPGLVIAAIMQRAFEATAYTVMFDKLEAAIGDVLGAPLSSFEIVLGWITSAVVVSLGIGVSVWAAMLPFGIGLPNHPLAMIWFLVTSTVLFASLGLILSILSEKWDALAGKETFLMIPVIFLSGTFFPLSAVPEGAWRTLFQFNPIFYLVDGFRWSVADMADADPMRAGIVAGVAALVALFGAIRLVASGYRLKP